MSNLNILKEKLRTFVANSQPRLGVLLVGILLVLAGFWSYSNFSRQRLPEEEVKIESAEGDVGSVAGGATGPEVSQQTPLATADGITTRPEKWVARNIERNTIREASYKVQSGDTLWEIAEGKYGSGFEWTKIRDANKDKIGFLPNGSQALIEVGQDLSLP